MSFLRCFAAGETLFTSPWLAGQQLQIPRQLLGLAPELGQLRLLRARLKGDGGVEEAMAARLNISLQFGAIALQNFE
jgi:hypothetical protein